MSNSQDVINHVRKRKKDLISIFDSKCCICGFNQFQEALEFHHVDPTQKEFGITSSSAVTRALDKQIIEAKKCVLVCANCHRGIHAGYIKVPDDYTKFFNEDRAEYLLKENEKLKHGVKYYCQRCGTIISTKNAKYCVECAKIAQ